MNILFYLEEETVNVKIIAMLYHPDLVLLE